MKKILTSSVVAVAVLFGSISLDAKEMTSKDMVQNSVKKEMKLQNSKFDKSSNAIVVALHKTFKALSSLQFGKDKEALKLLKEADKDFENILKKDPNLKLIPVENQVELFAFAGSSKDIKIALDSAVSLIKHHKTQSARDILIPLKDEMDITTMYIPMQTYPAVIKKSISELEKGDKKMAFATLVDGMNTIVGEKVVIPLSFLMSQDLIVEASQLDKNKKDEALKLLKMASDELDKSVLLGYADENTKAYKSLQSAIKNLEKEIKGKNKVEKLYENLKNDFKSFIDKVRGKKESVNKLMNSKAEAEVRAYEKKQMQKAIKESDEFKKEAVSDLKKTDK